MADGVKLASGYVELTVKKAGDAMKEITAEITGVGKQAEKVGKQAGDALNQGITKGATAAGKSVQDAITAGAQKAGAEAGKAAGEALNKGMTKGAQDAGKSVQDEIGKATTATRGQIVKDLGGAILDGARQGAKDAGVDLDKELVNAAGKAGAKVGQVLHDAIASTPLGDAFKGLNGVIQPTVDGLRSIGDVVTGMRDRDAAGTLNGVAGALNAIGQTSAASTVQTFATHAGTAQQNISALKTAVADANTVMPTFVAGTGGAATKMGALGTAAAAAAGPIAAAVAGMLQIQQLSKEGNDKLFGGQRVLPQDGVPLTPWWFLNRGEAAMNGKGWSAFNPFDSSPDTPGHGLPGSPPPQTPAPVGPPAPAAITAPATDYSWLPKRAKGGVTPAGRIYGPGTGISDSIIGIGADGLPTARVSTGEGIVKKSAMDNGGAAIVAALNGGMKLPGYDDGTNNVGGPPIPVPSIKVPQATTGAAGQLNDFLNTSQGHPYQYATLWDCSGYMSQLYNKITGKQMPRFNTESDLAAYGFVRGSKPGEFNLGIHHGGGGPNSHMAGTLPDGRAVESAGNGVQVGAGAHGANDPQFEDHWYLPGSGAMAGLGASITGAPDNPADMFAVGAPGGKDQRTQGYIPAGAGGSGQAGTSLWSGAMQMGASAVNGLIEQAASAASTAISAAATAGSFGAGGEAGGAASQFLIGIGTKMAERGVQYGFQMAGIGGDALAEILLPFGVPRFFQTDPSQFMPQLPGQAAAVTTGEKAQGQQAGLQTPSPSGPVQPGQMAGQQPVGPSVPIATEGTGNFTPAPTGAPGLSGPQTQGPAVPAPQPSGSPAPVQGPQPVQPKPQQAPQGAQPPLQPTDLAGLLGLARGGVVPGVYDDGGWLMPNGIAINKSKRPEPILNADQWGDMHAIAAQGMPQLDPKAANGYAPNFSVNIDSVTVKDVNELQREIDSRQRLQMWRHAGRP